MLRVSKSI